MVHTMKRSSAHIAWEGGWAGIASIASLAGQGSAGVRAMKRNTANTIWQGMGGRVGRALQMQLGRRGAHALPSPCLTVPSWEGWWCRTWRVAVAKQLAWQGKEVQLQQGRQPYRLLSTGSEHWQHNLAQSKRETKPLEE